MRRLVPVVVALIVAWSVVPAVGAGATAAAADPGGQRHVNGQGPGHGNAQDLGHGNGQDLGHGNGQDLGHGNGREAVGSAPVQARQRPDPPTDRIGWENGYWYDDPIDVNQSDGLSDRELHAYVSRAMARVEYLRHEEFKRSVPVEVINRSEFRGRATGDNNTGAAFAAWNNQVWEALFVQGEDGNVQNDLRQTTGAAVAGFYSPTDDEIKIVTDSPNHPTIDNATLIHELTHALQDQTVDLTSKQLQGQTQDEDLAIDGLVEGEANLVEDMYKRRCGDQWQCVATPPGDRSGGERPNLGILLTMFQPYSDGPVYVNDLRKREGWGAVRAAFDDPPASTEQVIHRTNETPRPISFSDHARNGWRTYPNQGENGSDTAGEASIYVMFWYQARTAGADTVDPRSIARTSAPFDTYNYDAKPSAGWANDRIFPYRNGPVGGNGTRHGYVWVTEWDTERDARQFRRAYGAILDAHDAKSGDGRIRVVPHGPFADAFLVVRKGRRVVIVNGPTPGAVRDIRPGLAAAAGSATPSSTGSGALAPGFGAVAAVVAVLGAALVALRRRRWRP